MAENQKSPAMGRTDALADLDRRIVGGSCDAQIVGGLRIAQSMIGNGRYEVPKAVDPGLYAAQLTVAHAQASEACRGVEVKLSDCQPIPGGSIACLVDRTPRGGKANAR